MNTYIGIDLGTTGAKTLLMAEDGTVLRSAAHEYPLTRLKSNWAEQDPVVWWDAVVQTIREALDGADTSRIRGVGLTGQMHGLVCLDRTDEVLRPAILWCDQRTAEECAEITDKVGAERLIELTANPMLTGFTAPKILWVRKNQPRIYEHIDKMLLPKDYIRYMLTGDNASDVSDASGTGLFNVARRTWDDEVLGKLEIDRRALGEVFESCEITGGVSTMAAELTGIPAGTPVVAGAGDNAAAAIGTGVSRDGDAFVTIGSSGVVFVHTQQMRQDPLGRVHTFCAAVPGEWHVMGVTLAAGQSLKWFRDRFVPTMLYSSLDELAERVPIGSEGLIFLPYLNGERSPHLNPEARGAFVGLTATHGIPELVRAIMEGVTCSLCDCRDVMAGMGADFADITACGGGGGSAFWRQMLADAMGVRVGTAQTQEGPALGAAMLAAVGVGAYASVQEACGAIIKRGEYAEPNAAVAAEYARLHAEYKALYPALKESFTALAAMG